MKAEVKIQFLANEYDNELTLYNKRCNGILDDILDSLPNNTRWYKDLLGTTIVNGNKRAVTITNQWDIRTMTKHEHGYIYHGDTLGLREAMVWLFDNNEPEDIDNE